MAEETNNKREFFEVDFLDLANKCLKHWKFILCCLVAFFVIGYFFAKTIPQEYTARETLAPERARSSASARGLSSIAGIAGVSLPTATSDAMTPILFPDIVMSTPFVVDLFDIPIEFEKKGETISTTIKDYFLKYQKQVWWRVVLSSPRRVIGLVRSIGKKASSEEARITTDVDVSELTVEQAMALGSITGSTSVDIDKKTYLISVSARAQHPEVARDICRAVTERLQSYCEDYYTSKSRKDLEYYETLLEDAKRDYYSAMQKFAAFTDANQDVVLRSRLSESVKLQNEMELQYALYTSCAQQVQQAKAQVQKETPVFTVINPASKPFGPSSRTRTMVELIFPLIGLILSILWILLKIEKK